MNWRPTFGAWPDGDGIRFRVWAPGKQIVEVVLEGPESRAFPLEKHPDETFGAIMPDIEAGARYRYCVDGRGPFPDPASRFQPEGVHGPSEVMDPIRFGWTDEGWQGVSPAELIIYELHVGTFSPEGTFEGVTRRLSRLAELGVTAVELMPVADFPGCRNWGYDGVDSLHRHAAMAGRMTCGDSSTKPIAWDWQCCSTWFITTLGPTGITWSSSAQATSQPDTRRLGAPRSTSTVS